MPVHKMALQGDNPVSSFCFSLCRLVDAEVRRRREDEAGHRQRQRTRVAVRMGGEELHLNRREPLPMRHHLSDKPRLFAVAALASSEAAAPDGEVANVQLLLHRRLRLRPLRLRSSVASALHLL